MHTDCRAGLSRVERNANGLRCISRAGLRERERVRERERDGGRELCGIEECHTCQDELRSKHTVIQSKGVVCAVQLREHCVVLAASLLS